MFEHQPLNHFTVVMLGHKFVVRVCMLMQQVPRTLCTSLQSSRWYPCVFFIYVCTLLCVGGRKVGVAGVEEEPACSHIYRLSASY